jgi:hypothetical protein
MPRVNFAFPYLLNFAVFLCQSAKNTMHCYTLEARTNNVHIAWPFSLVR